MGKLWDLIEQHRDAQAYPPTYRRISQELGVSQSLFDTWKAPKRLPTRQNIEAIARVVGVSYQTVLEAALDDTRYRIPPSRDEKDGEEHERSAPTKQARESRAASEQARELAAQHARAGRAEQRFRAAAEKIQPGLADRIRQAAEVEPPSAGRSEPTNVLDLDVPQTGQAAAALLRKMGPLVAAARDLSVLNSGTTITAADIAADRILNIVEAQAEWAHEIELAIEEQAYNAELAREKRGRAPLRAVAFETADDLDAEVEGQQQEP